MNTEDKQLNNTAEKYADEMLPKQVRDYCSDDEIIFSYKQTIELMKKYAAQFQIEQKQGACVWVKYADRKPDKEYNYFVKVECPYQHSIYNATSVFDLAKKSFIAYYDTWGHATLLNVIEWLDETPQPTLTEQDIQAMSDEKWISVDERLPINDDNVLVINKNKIDISFYDNWSQMWGGKYLLVTHWQPLPKPPSSKEQKQS